MGTTFVPAPGDPLDAIREELVGRLNDDDPPDWLYVRGGLNEPPERLTEDGWSDRRASAAKSAADHRRKVESNPAYDDADVEAHAPYTARKRFIVYKDAHSRDTETPPESVRDRLLVRSVDADAHVGHDEHSAAGYRLAVYINTDGRVVDAELGRDFNH